MTNATRSTAGGCCWVFFEIFFEILACVYRCMSEVCMCGWWLVGAEYYYSGIAYSVCIEVDSMSGFLRLCG